MNGTGFLSLLSFAFFAHWLNGKFDMHSWRQRKERKQRPRVSLQLFLFCVASESSWHFLEKNGVKSFSYWKLESAKGSQVGERKKNFNGNLFKLNSRDNPRCSHSGFVFFLVSYWIVGKCQTPTSDNLLVHALMAGDVTI